MRASALARVLLAVFAVAPSGACQIFGISAIPCDPNVPGQCPDGLVCRDAVCAVPTPVDDDDVNTEVPGAVRDVDDNCADPPLGPASTTVALSVQPSFAGTRALAGPLEGFGGDVALHIDGEACFERPAQCPITALDTTRAPVALVAEHALTGPVPTSPLEGIDIGTGTFGFEAVVRMPSEPSTVLIGERNGDFAFELTTAASADGMQLELELDGGVVILAGGVEGRWVHLVCVLEPERARGSAADGVLCAVDGGPPALGSIGSAGNLGGGPLSLHVALDSGSALASLTLFSGIDTLAADNLATLDKLVATAGRRLFAYQGLVQSPARPIDSIGFFTVRALPLPADDDAPPGAPHEALALVGGRWPMVTPGAGGSALVLEPTRADLSLGAFRVCDSALRFTGLAPSAVVHDACVTLRPPPEVVLVRPSVAAPLVWSGYVERGRAETELLVAMGPPVGAQCTVTFPDGVATADPSCTLDLEVEEAGGAQRTRVVLRSPSVVPVGNAVPVVVELDDPGDGLDDDERPALWGAQVEQGFRATSVIAARLEPSESVSPAEADQWRRDADGFVVHSINDALVDMRLAVEIETPPADGTFSALTLLRDLFGYDSWVALAFEANGAAVTATGVVTGLATADGEPVSTTAPGTSGTFGADSTLVVASTRAADACDSPAGCVFVQLPTLPQFMALSHVFLGASDEPLRVRTATATVEGLGAPPLGLHAVVEPRVMGCTYGGSVLAQLDVCAEDVAAPACGDVALEAADASEELAPLAGRTARVLAQEAQAALSFDAENGTMVEARLRMPSTDGQLLLLEDDAGEVLALESDAGVLQLHVRGETVLLDTVVDEWVQVLCAFAPRDGGRVVCIQNLTYDFVVNTSAPVPSGGGTVRVAPGVAFDRVRVQQVAGDGYAPFTDVLALFRAPQSFGFHRAGRRDYPAVADTRVGLAYVQNGSQLFLVGSHWPRSAVAARKPALLIEPALADRLDDGFAGFLGADALTASDEPGPGPRSRVVVARDVTLEAGGFDAPGCASVFVKRRAEDARVDVRVDDVTVRSPSEGGWRRVSACTSPSRPVDTVQIDVRGEVLLAHPQLDGLAVTTPAVADARNSGTFELLARDLTLGVFGFDLGYDADVRGEGAILQLLVPDADDTLYALRASRAFDASNDEGLDFALLGSVGGLPFEELQKVELGFDPSGDVALRARQSSLWVRSATGAEIGTFFLVPINPAYALEIGAANAGAAGVAAVRLHSLDVTPVFE